MERILILRIHGDTIRVAANHPFWVEGRGWINASELRVGDRLRWRGVDAAIEAITDGGDEEIDFKRVVLALASSPLRMGAQGMSAFSGDAQIHTADGPKNIEDIKPGDEIIVRNPFDPRRN